MPAGASHRGRHVATPTWAGLPADHLFGAYRVVLGFDPDLMLFSAPPSQDHHDVALIERGQPVPGGGTTTTHPRGTRSRHR